MKAVYVLTAEGRGGRKIGCSGNPDVRRRQIELEVKLPVVCEWQMRFHDARLVEAVTHWLLRDKCIIGEWFNVELGEATRFIAEAAARVTNGFRVPDQTGEPIMVRLQSDLLELLDDWRREQKDLPNRSEAIRRMITHCVSATNPAARKRR